MSSSSTLPLSSSSSSPSSVRSPRSYSGSKWIVLGAAVVVLGASLLLSMQSTHTLSGAYKSLYELTSPGGSAGPSSQTSPSGSSRRDDESGSKKKKKDIKDMNIVLFYADDWTWSNLGFVNHVVKTPNIDEMARNGIHFPHNCVTTSICWQSRATKSTGLYASVHQNLRIWDGNMFKTIDWRNALYPQLRSAGYNVGFFGKWHAAEPDEHMKYTFDHFKNYYGDHWQRRKGQIRHITDLNKEDALEYLTMIKQKMNEEKASSGQNGTAVSPIKFALTVSFYATHGWDGKLFPDQYCPMNYSEPLYDGMTIPTAKTATEEEWEKMPWFFTEENEGRKRWRLRFDTPDHYQVSMKRLMRMASEADDVVGAVVQELKDMGVYDNTLLVFTTDNGNFHGEHGLADKWYPHEESIRVPLVIQDPRMPDHLRGTKIDEFTLNIDLAPTLLGAAGLETPRHMQGRDIADLYLADDPASVAASWRKDFFYEWSQGRPEDAQGHGPYSFIPAVFALIRRDYKYFYWPQVGYEQLYQIAVDPLEEHDVINTTDSDTIARLKARYAELKNLSQSGYRV